MRDLRNQVEYTQLRLDNKNRPWAHYLTINESRTSYTFDELHLDRKASIHLPPNSPHLKVTVNKITGDRTGLIHIHANQTFQTEFRDAEYTITRTATNFKIDRDAVAVMATSVHIVGRGSVAFDWNGRLVNVQHLHIAHGRKTLIGKYSHTAGLTAGRYSFVDPPGSFRFSTLEFGSGTVIDYPPPMGVHFTVSLLVSTCFTFVSRCCHSPAVVYCKITQRFRIVFIFSYCYTQRPQKHCSFITNR